MNGCCNPLDGYSTDRYGVKMKPSETLLEMARRHVRESEDHLLHQLVLVQRLEEMGSPLAREARALLARFKSMLSTHKGHPDQIEEEIQSGLRDADGKLRLHRR